MYSYIVKCNNEFRFYDTYVRTFYLIYSRLMLHSLLVLEVIIKLRDYASTTRDTIKTRQLYFSHTSIMFIRTYIYHSYVNVWMKTLQHLCLCTHH